MALLKLDRVGVSAGGVALLKEISLTLAKGQRLGVIGDSGAGKSLLARAIAGLLPDGATVSGSVLMDDAAVPATEAQRAKLRGKRIGVLLQQTDDGLDPLQTVGAQIGEALTVAGESGGIAAAVTALLADVGLEAPLAQLYPRDLDNGSRRLVAIALALAGKPDLLIADAPTEGLDSLAQRRVADLIERHCREREMALLLISHDLRLIALLCTRVLVLKAGQMVELGSKEEVFGHPRHSHTRLVMSAGRHRARTLMRTPIGAVLLEVRHVSKRYRRPSPSLRQPQPPVLALNDVSLAIRLGETMALVGTAGSGKSTLARIIAGLERASSGELEIDHTIYHGPDLPPIQQRDIGFVFHDPMQSFNPRLTVGESIAEPLQLEPQRLMDELSARIVEAIAAVGLSTDMLTRMPAEFPASVLARLALARALVTRPKLVVLDEPLAALDVTARGELPVMLNRLRADFGLTFLMTAQDLSMVRIVADRVLVMEHGRIVEAGTPTQLLDNPQQPITQRLVAAALPEIGIVPVF